MIFSHWAINRWDEGASSGSTLHNWASDKAGRMPPPPPSWRLNCGLGESLQIFSIKKKRIKSHCYNYNTLGTPIDGWINNRQEDKHLLIFHGQLNLNWEITNGATKIYFWLRTIKVCSVQLGLFCVFISR